MPRIPGPPRTTLRWHRLPLHPRTRSAHFAAVSASLMRQTMRPNLTTRKDGAHTGHTPGSPLASEPPVRLGTAAALSHGALRRSPRLGEQAAGAFGAEARADGACAMRGRTSRTCRGEVRIDRGRSFERERSASTCLPARAARGACASSRWSLSRRASRATWARSVSRPKVRRERPHADRRTGRAASCEERRAATRRRSNAPSGVTRPPPSR